MKLVPCYPLSSVLSAKQWKAVRPYLCATFMETWMRIVQSHAVVVEDGSGRCVHCNAREAIRSAANRVFVGPAEERVLYARATAEEEGRAIEDILYQCAMLRSVPAVMAPPRKPK